MLADSLVVPTIPVTDMDKAKAFYVDKLGLKIVKEAEMGVELEAGKGSHLYIYQRGPSTADHTLAGFSVSDLEAKVQEMKEKGIVFEQYDLPGLKTDENGIATSEKEKERGAWFKDPFGNILAISQGFE